MKIKYTYVTGETVEIEAPEDIGAVIVESRHQEALNDRKENRRHYHYDVDDVYEGEEYGREDADLLALIPTEAEDEVAKALSCLTEIQRDVIKAIYLEGYLAREYAEIHGISEAAVSKAKAAAMKKMKKFLLEG